MFGKLKAIAAILVAGVTITSSTALATKSIAKEVVDSLVDSEKYIVALDGTTLTVDRDTLNLEAKRGDKVWYSGKRGEENDGLNENFIGKLTDGVTIGYRAMNTGNAKEQSITGLNPKITFKERTDGFDAKIYCRTIDLTFTLQVRIKNNTLQFKVPFDTIEEGSPQKNQLAYLTIYPFFDSSYMQVEGEILVPDGSGGIIDLSRQTPAKQNYSARVFGDDYSISAKKLSSTTPQNATMPLYAMMYSDHGTMVTADSGEEYCAINAYASTNTIKYNFAYFNWIYRESYVKYYESSGTAGKSYEAFQENKNEFDIVQTMTLFENACNYVDVANAYSKKIDIKKGESQKDVGLRLQFLMAENKKGMFGDEVVVMTKTENISNIVDQVNAYCKNIKVSLLGYTAGGLSGSYPNHFPLEGGTGSSTSYKKLNEKISSLGGELSFETDYAKAYLKSSVDNRKLTLNISNQFTQIESDKVGPKIQYNLLNPQDGMAMLTKDLNNIKKYTNTIDYSSICSLLYSGYRSKDFSRANAATIFKEGVASTGLKANMVKPNSYMWAVCDGYLDAPISCSGFMIISRSVPFLQVLLSGNMPIYSTPINLNYTGEDLVLRLIDYNVYPTFLLTQKDAMELYGTSSMGIFTSSFDIWKDSVKDIYTQVNAILSQVTNSKIVAKTVENNLQITTYSNNKKVVVNYTNSDIVLDTVTIKAKSAVVL